MAGSLPHAKDEHGIDRVPVALIATLIIHDSDGAHAMQVCCARGDDRMAAAKDMLSSFPPPIRFMLAMGSAVEEESKDERTLSEN